MSQGKPANNVSEHMFNTLPAGSWLFEPNGVLIGHHTYNGQTKPIYLSDRIRSGHVFVVGRAGTGKSILLSQLVAQDMAAGRGVCVMEPYGDLIDEILPLVPASRLDDVILFDPTDTERPLGLNVLKCPRGQRELTAQHIARIIIKVLDPDVIHNPKIALFLQAAVLLAMSLPRPTWTEVINIATDQDYRAKLLETSNWPLLEYYFSRPASEHLSSDEWQKVSGIMEALHKLIATEVLAGIVDQQQPQLDFIQAVAQQGIVLINLSRGRLSEAEVTFLGMLLQLQLLNAMWPRLDATYDQVQPFFVYLDEVYNYCPLGIASLLTEAKRARFTITFTVQFLQQLPAAEVEAILTGSDTLVVFSVGISDTMLLNSQFGLTADANDLMQQPKFQACVRTVVDGQWLPPFAVDTTIDYAKQKQVRASQAETIKLIRDLSRLKYGRSRDWVVAEADLQARL